ncbi:MAG: divalent-cation tolerance protein CutA [Candidatus Nitronauta litoralis]|uniref:Divalent-cation tolerance protein CutA n=1 Tax=Candidatus Nitronauta litoralis TaxID=2705533 RepID=A0A7T0FZA1_9BACT|nr:MAG: divalent-cation tolerance protein CutA [Candidatus Nitronauta litoralis]
MSETEHIVVLITAGSKEEAGTLARGLVENKHAFCVNIVPGIESVYHWEGKIHNDPEFLLIVKTRREIFDALKSWVVEHHSYDVPEVIALPITSGLGSYLKGIDDWVQE